MPLDTRIPLMAQPIQMPDFNALALQRQEQQRNAFLMDRMRQQDAAAQQTGQRRAQIGGMAAQGDFAGASKAALEAGDFDIHQLVAGLDAEQKKAARERNREFATLALSVANKPYEARRAILEASAPFFANMGLDPQQVAQFDPTDENIDSVLQTAQGFEEALKRYDKQNEPFTLGEDQVRFDGRGNVIARGPEGLETVNTPEGTVTTILRGGGGPAQASGGIPFEALIGLESGGNHFTKSGGVMTSPKGAIGIAQVMPGTAPEAADAAGLPWDANRYRNDPAYNRALGEAYYNKMRQRYGDDIKAAAAYNAGPGAVDKALAGGGDWLSRLPQETQDYVGRLAPRNRMAGTPRQIVNPKRAGSENAPSGYRWAAGGNLEPIPGGPADPRGAGNRNTTSDRKASADLRKEFNNLPEVKDFKDVRASFQQIASIARNPKATAQDDIALVFSFMKMLDPGSVVREGEFALAGAAASLPEQIQIALERVDSGQRLTPQQRQEMLRTAKRVYDPREEIYNQRANEYQGYARDSGIDPLSVAKRYLPPKKKQGGGNVIRYDAQGKRIP